MLSTAHSLVHDVLGDSEDVDKMLQPIVNLLESVLNLFYKHLPECMSHCVCGASFFAVYEAAGAVLSQLPHAVVLREWSYFLMERRLTVDLRAGDENCGWLCLSPPMVQTVLRNLTANWKTLLKEGEDI